eukprot:2931283-Rhodomonas_salina.2
MNLCKRHPRTRTPSSEHDPVKHFSPNEVWSHPPGCSRTQTCHRAFAFLQRSNAATYTPSAPPPTFGVSEEKCLSIATR